MEPEVVENRNVATGNDIESIVNSLKKWLEDQEHIPLVSDEKLLYHFAAASKGNFEVACKKLDSYFTVRNLIPELFKSRDPLCEEIKCNCECVCLGYLPGLSLDNSKVLYSVLLDPNPDLFDLTQLLRRCYCYLDINFLKDHQPGQGITFILDCKYSGFSHMMKVQPSIVRKAAFCLQNVYPIKLQGIIFINAKEIVKFTINNVVKPIFRSKLRKRIHVYNEDEFDKLHLLIPKEMLPKDIGGEGLSYREVNEMANNQLLSERDWLLTEGSVSTDESKRNGKCPISAPGCCLM